jgi:hypothetical protein
VNEMIDEEENNWGGTRGWMKKIKNENKWFE